MQVKDVFSNSMCTPCIFRNEPMEATCWCMTCKEGLCVNCSNHHRSLKALKRHGLVSFKDRQSIPEFAQSVQETCFEHERSFDFFCCDHQEYHCIKCSTLDHKTCNSVLLLEDIVRNAKSSVTFCHIEEGLNVLLSKIETILNKAREAISNINIQVNEISNNVQEMRTQIHKKLEEEIGEFLRKLDELKTESKTKAHETVRGLKEKLNVIQDLKASVVLLNENGTDLQVYLSLKHLESNLSKEENNITTNIENGQYANVEFVFYQASATQSLCLVGKVGEIKVKQKPLKSTLEAWVKV